MLVMSLINYFRGFKFRSESIVQCTSANHTGGNFHDFTCRLTTKNTTARKLPTIRHLVHEKTYTITPFPCTGHETGIYIHLPDRQTGDNKRKHYRGRGVGPCRQGNQRPGQASGAAAAAKRGVQCQDSQGPLKRQNEEPKFQE